MSLREQLEQGRKFLIYDVLEKEPVVIILKAPWTLSIGNGEDNAEVSVVSGYPEVDNRTSIWTQLLKIRDDLVLLSIPAGENLDILDFDSPKKRKEVVERTLVHHGYREAAEAPQQEAKPVKEDEPDEAKPSPTDGQKEAEIDQPDYPPVLVVAIVTATVVAGLIVVAIA